MDENIREEILQENKMGTMPVGRLLFSMAVPMMVSMLFQALYNVVDSIFVAKLSQDAMNAVSLAFPLQTLCIAFSGGTGVGMNALLSRSLGEKKQEMADRVLETLGIRDLAARGINEISGGERQLALIARAMAQQAKILLMDEPTASLDYGNQFRLLRQVRQLADSGYTVLLSTHNPEHAFRFATDVLVLREGGVQAFGPAAETLTEELLREIYRIPLTVADIPVPGGSVKGCVYNA